MIVHFHGSDIPLQGIPVIEKAKQLLAKRKDIEVRIIGPERYGGRLPFAELVNKMREADVCLGIFGTTRKANMVIPNKVYEALSLGKPIITADTFAVRELLNDEQAMLIPAGNAYLLADAITKLAGDEELRERLGRAGHELFVRELTPRTIVHNLTKELNI